MGGPGHEHDKGPRMHGGNPVERLSEELALTPEQKQKLETKLQAQMKAQQATMKNKMEAGMKHLDAVGTAFEGDKFDAKKAGVGNMGPDMIKAMAKGRVEFVQTVLSVLTPEQRAKFAEHVRTHAGDPDMPQQAGG
jgi:Spy/CpxP family protein refolding chaperone